MTGASLMIGDIAARMQAASAHDTFGMREELSRGQSIHHGHYLIHGVLGRGSFATVYDAEHVELARRVAIKVPRWRRDYRPSLHERFVREARMSVLVQHPNVLGIYDCGALPDGTPFLVFEHIEGETLNTMIERGPLELKTVIEIGRQLASALAALVDAGIVHRDIKPANVMLQHTASGSLRVKLLDFGVAKRTAWRAVKTITLQGELVGTPQYMAAEQLRGEEVDGRTDIYALSAVLYEALTGRPPHECLNLSDYVASALSAQVEPIRALRRDCPASLEASVLRGLQSDRTLRQPTPAELADELDVCALELALRPRGEEPPSPSAQVLRNGRRALRRAVPNVGLLCLLTCVFFFVLLGGSRVWEALDEPTPALTHSEPPALPVVQPPPPEPVVVPSPEPAAPVQRTAHPVVKKAPPRPLPRRVEEPASEPVSELLAQAMSEFVASHYDQARDRYRRILQREPSNAAALRGLGLAALQLGEPVAARDALRRYLEVSPHAPDTSAIERRLAAIAP
ncbi:MAG: tetratricopeptide repeat protein [Polyangiales bacterium]